MYETLPDQSGSESNGTKRGDFTLPRAPELESGGSLISYPDHSFMGKRS